MDAPYSGGTVAGGRIYAVDGDMRIAAPCGAPEIVFPLQGDSQPRGLPIILLDRTQNPPVYVSLPIGMGFNVQDFNTSQATMLIEQEFMVAESWYAPMALNTLYNPAWSVGWGLNGEYADIGNCFLVEEGPLIDVGGGIVRFKRKFCNLPPNRNEYESYSAQVPALDYGGNSIRFGLNKIVSARIFNEYFVVDNFGLLPAIPLFPAGHRLTTNELTNYASVLLFEETKYFKGEPNAIVNNNVLDADQPVTNDAAGNPPAPTTPSYTDYSTWANFNNAAGIASEIVAEASSFTRWMGNIYVRRTRFVLAQ